MKTTYLVSSVRYIRAGFSRLSLGLLVAAGMASVASAAGAGTTPIATVTTAIDFTDLQTDLTAFMVALLALFLVIISFRLGINWLKKLASG